MLEGDTELREVTHVIIDEVGDSGCLPFRLD